MREKTVSNAASVVQPDGMGSLVLWYPDDDNGRVPHPLKGQTTQQQQDTIEAALRYVAAHAYDAGVASVARPWWARLWSRLIPRLGSGRA